MKPETTMNTERLMEEAIKRTGLKQWGEIGFVDALKTLVDSFNTDSSSAPLLTRQAFYREMVGLLSNRLRIEDEIMRHPEILDVKLEVPLFIIGLPRTGSTLLHNLLAQDPSCRFLAFWETINPSPPPDRNTYDSDPRIKLAEERLDRRRARFPDLEHKHETTATGPEECKRLFNFTFMSDFGAKWRVPSYMRWLNAQDRTESYRYYRRLLQLLTWRCRGDHLVLKSPSHLANIDALLRVFPDANVVWLHRNPLFVVPSICSLRSTLMGTFQRVPKGWQVLRHCSDSIRKALAFRDSEHPEHFHDVQYKDLLKDAFQVVKGIYCRFGYELPGDMRQKVSDWLAGHPQHKHGVHRYRLEDYGLEPDAVKAQFSDYCHRFGIEM